MKKFLNRIWLMCESLKSFLLFLIAVLVFVIVAGLITHNFLKINEIPGDYKGPYYNLIQSTEKAMNVYTVGDFGDTIVIMSDYATISPVMKYKDLAQKLSESFHVVIVEYYGYGFSNDIKTERTNKNYTKEIHNALQNLGLEDNVVLMPIGISNIYAMDYLNEYPDEVLGVVSYDGLYPKEIESNEIQEDIKNVEMNARFYSIIENFGVFRAMSYIKPDLFGMDKVSSKDTELYRKVISNSYYTSAMTNQIKELPNNMRELVDFEYPEDKPVLALVSSEYENKYKDYSTVDRKKIVKDVFSNTSTQEEVKIKGNHDFSKKTEKEIAEIVYEFVNKKIDLANMEVTFISSDNMDEE